MADLSSTNGSNSTTSSDCEGVVVNRRNEATATAAALVNNSSGRVKLRDVNPYLVCVLCHGSFVDATSIAECLGLHSCKYLPPC